MTKGSFLRNAAIYGAGDLLVYAAGFLLLPLYVRALSPAEYGTLDVLNRLGEVVLLCLLFKGLRQAMFSFHNQARDERERRAVVGSALFVTLLLLGLGGGIACVAAAPISEWLDLGTPDVLRLAVLAVFVEALSVLLLALAQARQEASFHAMVSIGQFLLRVTMCIVAVACLGWGIAGVLWASVIASGVCVLGLLLREARQGGFRITRGQVWELLRFALPFVPAGIGFFLLNSGDRFFLLAQVSREELGAYALGYKLALLVKLFSRQPLYKVWSARMYEAARQPDAPVVFGQVFSRILMVYVGVGLGLCLIASDVVQVLAGAGYAAAARIIAPVVLAYFFLTAADLMESGLYIRRRTGLKLPLTVVATAATLGLYAWLIPLWGIDGAALGTLGGFVVNVVVTGVVTQRVFPVQYEWGRVALALALAMFAWVGSLLLPAGIAYVPLKMLVGFVWLVLLWQLVLTEEEKNWVCGLLPGLRRKGDATGTRRLIYSRNEKNRQDEALSA